ncbi:peroxidase 31-like [Punica granatum]|uniref:Peroxidase n=2 Tax=Punica granatum TaxID=22663 RepID=A0A218WGC8_PUNGR|nr:peroxidase 31-like [Punica granatum]OWM71583.1 hypothetical protein CDL15_Pgr005770 [Punica granatum]PKI33790.1 hypothetical protein CRG98_045821 [Punica granatum]
MAPQPLSPATLFLVLLSLCSSFLLLAESRLTTDYYSKSCPRFADIVRDAVTNKQITNPTTAAATLRVFFHDCLPNGCDGSILLSPTPFNPSPERTSDINLSLPGDAFDLLVRAKTALELACPGTVSCSDILAAATRDLVTMVGGPHYNVYLGRRDTRVSKASLVDSFLPRPNMTVSQLISLFASRGFSVQDMVALTGAHTIGFSHCKEFSAGIYNYSRSSGYDPSYNPRFAQGLQGACSNYRKDPTLSVFNDIMSPNKFDNLYYQNLPKGLGLLASDRALHIDPRTRPFVAAYAADQNRFFRDFAAAMQKLSLYGIKTGRRGEIRRRCDAVN